ncbi:hypothetical protein [Neorhodopirellula pilleata]|uniref:HTH Mu-type domain-containing protein n=1 Tax=Neorhodopirellula pilleata TaxID=2714738 RepID=A0A5C6AYA3_9BACT|nr:hypothetical protein [Neorhodopirellula pilleata]TWU03124.1 hypothetical protein Pla100_00420 [Neorhodopirellula pilleata]
MSAIPAPVQQVLAARQEATASKINMQLLGKQLDVQKQVGDSINQLLEQTVVAQKQIAKGHLDVRV